MRRALPAGLLAAGALVALAACTSGSGDTSGTSAAPVDTLSASASSASPVTSEPTTSVATTSSRPTPTPTSTTPTPSPTVVRTPFTTTCTALSVRVLKGGAVRGAEIAAVQFVNDGSAACTITGTPTATLLRSGKAVGRPSTPSSTSAKAFTLQPGDTGESLLRDFSGCNAPLSDNLRVTGPTRNGQAGKTFTEPIVLRACTLQMAPVGPPA